MNSGIIASRYAKAFLMFVQESGSGDIAYSQASDLVRIMGEIPQLKVYITDAVDILADKKIELLSTALGTAVDASISRFLKMVTDHHRLEYFPRMLLSFIEQYRIANNIRVGTLVTAVENDGLRARLEGILRERTGAQVLLEEKVSPEIIGGFVFELDGYRLDASVENHLERIRRQLVEKNNRIV